MIPTKKSGISGATDIRNGNNFIQINENQTMHNNAVISNTSMGSSESI